MSRTAKQIISDRSFDQQHEQHVTKTNRLSVSFQLRDNQIIVSGEEGCVNMVEANPNMTIAELKEAMVNNVDIDDKYSYKITSPATVLPPLCKKFKGPSWNTKTAREEVARYFGILGFGQKGKKYNKEDESKIPAFWPDSIAYSAFKHPTREKLENLNLVMEAILQFYQLDADSHHTEILPEVDLTEPVRKKKKPSARSKEFVDSDEEDDDGVRGPVSADEHHEEEDETNLAGTTQDEDFPAVQDDLPMSLYPAPSVNPAPPVYPASPSASSSATPMPMLGKSSTTPAPSFSSNFIGRGLVPNYSDSESESDRSTNVTYHDESDLDMSD